MSSEKILLSCYSCCPDRGSEPGVGWNVALEMAQHAETHVLTCFEFKSEIEAKIATGTLPSTLHFHFYEIPGGKSYWKYSRKRGLRYHYYLWQCLATKAVAQLHQIHHFTSAQHLTFVKYNSPSCLRAGTIPYILGPVGAAEETPPQLLVGYSWRGRLFEYLRHLEKRLSERDPLVRKALRNASLVLATTQCAKDRIASFCPSQTIQLCSEAALSPEDLSRLRSNTPSKQNPPEIVTFFGLGRLVALKGYQLFLRAFAQANIPHARCLLIGDGPERPHLEALAQSLGFADRLTITGFIPRQEALLAMAQGDVMVHPSHHDSGGWASIEAMAAGKPVICMDYGGPGFNVTPETGIKVPVGTEAQVVQSMAQAMQSLADSTLRQTLSEAAQRRVLERYTWTHRVAFYYTLHQHVRQGFVTQ